MNQYQFNGKENLQDLGLGWSDYGARFYSSDAPHWNSVDPLAEKMRRWSPHAFSYGNPIRFMDPDGRSPNDASDPVNKVNQVSYNSDKKTYTVSETTTVSNTQSKVTSVDGPVPMQGKYFKETTITNTNTIKSVAEINEKGQVLSNTSAITKRTTETVKTAQTKEGLMFGIGVQSASTESTKQDKSVVGPMGAAMAYGLSNFGPEPPVLNNAQFRDAHSPDPVGAPDGATPGFGALGAAIIDAITGKNNSYSNMSGAQPDAGDFRGGKNSSSYGAYQGQMKSISSKFE